MTRDEYRICENALGTWGSHAQLLFTVDEKVYAALEQKKNVVEMVLRDMEEDKDGST